MAIEQANTFYKSFTFNGVVASDYGVYVTDVNVFDVPERDVEYIEIPGRNGAFVRDNKRFKNKVIKYSCAMQQPTDTDFATAISDFGNLLASTVGYQRLEDDIHPGEYRMASFTGGIEYDTLNQKAGEFDIVFDCKPQRFLKSGETAITVEDGDTVTNPTLFDAKPLLLVDGYGDIGINGETINIDDAVIGAITLANSVKENTVQFDSSALNTGDAITLAATRDSLTDANLRLVINTWKTITSASGSMTSGAGVVENYRFQATTGATNIYLFVWFKPFSVQKGTSAAVSAEFQLDFEYDNDGATQSGTITITVYVAYYPATNTFQIRYLYNGWGGQSATKVASYSLGGVTAYSTKSALGYPLYFDMDIGEAYKYEDDQIVSVNNAVSFPAELPVLKPGANVITFDNTVTDLQIVPRWWKV